MGRWKIAGLIIVEYAYDHDPRHVHVFEDGKRILKFNIQDWVVMEGTLSRKAKKALETLRKERAFCEKPKI